MSIGSFTLVKNEAGWIAPHILRILPFIDECVFFDGNSDDGTIEIIEFIQSAHPDGNKIRLVKDRDPKDLKEDYVRLFNECLRSLSTDLAIFLHPDMYVINPSRLLDVKDSSAVALTTKMRSFGGEPGGQLYEIVGRGPAWKNIYRLRNPDLGAHYWGHYGHVNEDVYFSAITGSAHVLHEKIAKYPYAVADSGLEILHFSDVRPYARRVDRMIKCLLNNKWTQAEAEEKAAVHPRVTFKSAGQFTFKEAEYPADFLAAKAMYQHLVKEQVTA